MVIKKKTRPDGEKLVKFLIRLLRLFLLLILNKENYIMKRFFILPEYADEPWGEADTIEEARTIREEIARKFINRRVAIIDNDWHEVD